MVKIPAILVFAAFVSVAAGCAPPTVVRVQYGIDAYAQGQYAAALQRFVEVEGDQGGLDASGQVRYLAYRGLTVFKLGQKAEAKTLLTKAKRAYDAGSPLALPKPIVIEMDAALKELGGP